MEKELPKTEDQEAEKKIEWEKARQEASILKDKIFNELERIGNMPDNDVLHDRLWNEVFNPPFGDREALQKYLVFHTIVGSSRTFEETPDIDLPGGDNLMSFYTKKLAELQKIH